MLVARNPDETRMVFNSCYPFFPSFICRFLFSSTARNSSFVDKDLKMFFLIMANGFAKRHAGFEALTLANRLH